MKNDVTQIRVKNKNIREVNVDFLDGLSLIMRDYESISLSECFMAATT